MASMTTTLRDEAQNPSTSPERLHELISLPGKRDVIDSDAGWCREYVAANPSAALATLVELAADQNDFMARLNAAKKPAMDEATVLSLVGDVNDLGARTPRPVPPAPAGRPRRAYPGYRPADRTCGPAVSGGAFDSVCESHSLAYLVARTDEISATAEALRAWARNRGG